MQPGYPHQPQYPHDPYQQQGQGQYPPPQTAPMQPGMGYAPPQPDPTAQYAPQTSALPYSQPSAAPMPGGFPQGQQTSQSGSSAGKMLTVVVAVLGVVLVVVGGITAATISSRNGEISSLEEEISKRKDAKAAAEAKQAEEFAKADLSKKLTTVEEQTRNTKAAYVAWLALPESGKLGGLHRLQEAENECFEAVLDYNHTAASFPESLITEKGLPMKIDMTASATSCNSSPGF